MGCAASAPAAPREPTAQELEAERHEVLIMETVQQYEQAMQALRKELDAANDAYRSELADETNRRLGSASSRDSRKEVIAKQERVRKLENELKDVHADFTEEMAQLRKEQRSAALAAEEGANESTTIVSSPSAPSRRV